MTITVFDQLKEKGVEVYALQKKHDHQNILSAIRRILSNTETFNELKRNSNLLEKDIHLSHIANKRLKELTTM